ncbi:hypothetical protein ABI_12100 [Asticcacaulis biprosthecium C19]|uniref:Lipoprotein n=1 Tax=Asticcacaulis biprosthecium C19 TaxID=715226 RepID=F4QHN6_9CAUL|nr:hypothetical protein [Asticcacaulis biprosthecium]EGF92773.1 hypothetical protein ABI_12100 [Asticcacaulis biprosthecium C19]
MGFRIKPAAVSAFLGLTACVSVSPMTQELWSQDIDLALQTSPGRLRELADGGDERAMIAYAIVVRYGLNGVAADPVEAARYEAMATKPAGYHTNFIWMPKTKDSPGYLMPITTATYSYSPVQAASVAACAAILAPSDDPPGLADRLARGVCGGEANYRRLKGQWHRTGTYNRNDGRNL